jgi:hypothetical protein
MKDVYYLPWDCNTSKKIRKVFAWITLIATALMVGCSIFLLINNGQSDFNKLFFILSIMSAFVSWFVAWVRYFINFPSIKCKPVNTPSKESV